MNVVFESSDDEDVYAADEEDATTAFGGSMMLPLSLVVCVTLGWCALTLFVGGTTVDTTVGK